jgi:AcrR family transcriptional regulator
MSAPASGRLPGSQRRALIEAAAARLFAEVGYEHTRLDDVASAAGVSKPILYRHFASKKALYLALLERHRAGQESTATRVAPEAALVDQLPALLDAWFANVAQHADTWAMIFRDTTGDHEIRAARARAQENARALIVAALLAQPELSLAPAEVEPAAELIRSAMAGLAMWSIGHPGQRRILVELIIDTLIGIRAGAARRRAAAG